MSTSHTNDELIAVPGGCCESALDQMPDACSNDDRQQRLIQRQQKDDGRSAIRRFFDRERNLLLVCVLLVIAMNFSEGRYILYPFRIFSTWVHEMCHGFAAILMGGQISEVNIFRDGSGLAYTTSSNSWKRGFIASAGYPGTATTGCLLLLFRRTTLGPTIGTVGIGLCMIMTCIFWVRGTFGLAMILSEGIFLVLCGWKLPAHILDNLFNFLAATCCLNAVESIQDLFAVGSYVIGGEEVTSSDAHTVAEKWGMDYRFWAILWLCMSFVLTVAGIVFARDARETLWMKGRTQDGVTPYDQSNYCSPEISVGPRRDDVESGNNNNNNNKTMTIAAVY
jgi:hypothetical protein